LKEVSLGEGTLSESGGPGGLSAGRPVDTSTSRRFREPTAPNDEQRWLRGSSGEFASEGGE
jgi:hypothetical protein